MSDHIAYQKPKSIGTAVRFLRKRKGWSMPTLAEKVKVSDSTILRLEKDGNVCVDVVMDCCRVFRIKLEELARMAGV